MSLSLLLILMILVFFSYILFIVTKYGVLESISDSYYSLPCSLKFLFTFFCWGFSLPAAIIGFSLSEYSIWQFFMLFAAGGIMFVGASPNFKMDFEGDIHNISAYIGVVSSQLFIFLVFENLKFILPTFIITSILLFLLKVKNLIWWIEILAFLFILITFYLKI